MEPRYDVAISFLSADETIAAAFHNALSASLEVFFYPRRQEELAGTDGLESMRGPFYDQSRVAVVLYRDRWGKTDWTRVEETAIKDRFLKFGWQGLFFVMLDGSAAPPWLPLTNVRYNYADFGFEGAAGAVKARVVDCGGSIEPLTALKRAELAKRETQYLGERQRLRSNEGAECVREESRALFKAIENICAQLNAAGSLQVEFQCDSNQCHLRNKQVSLLVNLAQPIEGASLTVRQYDRRLAVLGERLFYPNGEPRRVREVVFLPDMNRAGQMGWSEKRVNAPILFTDALADFVVNEFVDLAARADRGQLTRTTPPRRAIRHRFLEDS
ncbi:MAG TPA: hypothetical protein VGN17_02065 [Bryobacteraceae bacterium]